MSAWLKRWVLAFIVPRPVVGVFFLPRYLRDLWRFRAIAAPARRPAWRDTYPCLGDWTTTTPFDPHYFHQGAWLARRLATAQQDLHVDVGSSVMTLSVLSAWAPTVFVDVRPLRASITGLKAIAGSLVQLPFADRSVRSISCLHVIEHVGLGRYGDPLDASGADRAAAELGRVLAPGGRLYLSTPVGRERICFNAHRVFDPRAVSRWFPDCRLISFSCVDDRGVFHADSRPEDAMRLDYGCGMYVFERD